MKGGQALRMAEGITDRFSTDIDFSMSGAIKSESDFFILMSMVIKNEFNSLGYNVFDEEYVRKPKEKKPTSPQFWGGWRFEFKLDSGENRDKVEITKRRREAIVPRGSNISTLPIDISEYEYCDSVQEVKIDSVTIYAYSKVSLVIEKLRAICQQHDNYTLKSKANRSRDYYDIENMLRVDDSFLNQIFLKECTKVLPRIFEAKSVQLTLLKDIFESEFIEYQKQGWKQVENSVKGKKIQNFEYYVSFLKIFVDLIYKEN